jgi:superfamily II DNA/RNA helicase
MIIRIAPRANHFYHVVEERMLLRHCSTLFSKDRMPLLVIVNSLAVLASLYEKVLDWSGLPRESVCVFAAGFSDKHKEAADACFRDATNRSKIMIATTAYALGIDAFVHSVIHFGVPGSVPVFLQGAGRAGRDESILEAHCTVVVDAAGLRAADKFMRMFLGAARKKPQKPPGSRAMA